MLGKTLNQRYQLEQLLSKTELGSLFLATECASGEMLAVRTLPGETALRGEAGLRFLRLVQRLEGEEHPNVLSPLETGYADGIAYQVVPYYPAVTLEEALREASFSLAEGLSLLRQAARGLAHLHGLGIVHGGLTPRNLLISREEKSLQVVLADPCLYLLVGGEFPPGGLEAAPFRAPEEIPGLDTAPDERTDLYALGMIGYLVLAGRAPFTGVSVRQIMQRHLSEPPPAPRELNPELPRGPAAILEKLTAKAPDDRYQSAAGLLADLVQTEQPEANLPAGLTQPEGAAAEQPREWQGPRARFTPTPWIGREQAREAAIAALSRTASGRGALLAISGEEGCGKASLFRSLLPHAEAAEGLVLRADLPARNWCGPYHAPLALLENLRTRWPLLPLTRRRYLAQRIQQNLGGQLAILTDLQPLLSHLFPSQATAPPLPRWKHRQRVLHVLGDLFAALAAPRHPLLIWLGNAECADPDSLSWLNHLLNRLPLTPIVVMAGLTPSPGQGESPLEKWLAEVQPHPALNRLSLLPLDAGQMEALTLRRLGLDPLDPAAESGGRIALKLSGWIHRRWGGNPLTHDLVLGTLLSRNHLVPAPGQDGVGGGRWNCAWEEVESLELPLGLEDLLAARLAPLSEELRLVLECASVFPEGFSLEELSTVMEQLPPEALMEHVETAVAEHLLRRSAGRIAFAHRKFRKVFYLALGEGRKEHLHRLRGAMMEADPDGPPLLHHSTVAHHFRLAEDTARATRHELSAADTALRQQALFGACAGYEALMPSLEEGPNLPGVLVSLGAAQTLLGHHTRALETLHQAAALQLPEPLLMETLRLMARAEAGRGEPAAALARLEEGLAMLDESLPVNPLGAALARLAARARQRYVSLRAAAGAPGPAPLEGRRRGIATLLEQAALVLRTTDAERAVLADEKLLQLTATHQPSPIVLRAMIRLGEAQGDPDGPYFAEAGALLELYPFAHEKALLLAAQGRCLANLFEFRQAADLLYLASETCTAEGDPLGAAQALRTLLELGRVQGPCGAMLENARRLRALARMLETPSETGWAEAFHAYSSALAGKITLPDAADALRGAAEKALAQGDADASRYFYFLAADLHLATGQMEDAAACIADLPPKAENGGGIHGGLVNAARAELHLLQATAEQDNREWHMREAQGLANGIRAMEKEFPRLAIERTLLEVMRLLLEGHTDRAIELAQSGERLFESSGARIALGRLHLRLAEGLKAQGHEAWRHWAGKALSGYEATGATPFAAAARLLLEQDRPKAADEAAEPAQVAALEEQDGNSAAPDRALARPFPEMMLERLEQAITGTDGWAAALNRALLRTLMEAVNAEYGLLYLPDGPESLTAAAQWPSSAEEIEVNQWLIDTVWREGRGEMLQKFQLPAGKAAGAAMREAQSALCVPLGGGGAVQGLAYLGSSAQRMTFDESDLSKITPLAAQAGIGLGLGLSLEQGMRDNRGLRSENEGWQHLVAWSAQAAAQRDPQAVLAALHEEIGKSHGFSGIMLYWKDEQAERLVLDSCILNEGEGPEPAGYGSLPCADLGRQGAEALRTGRPAWVGPLTDSPAGDGNPALLEALGAQGGLWVPFPGGMELPGLLLLVSNEEAPPRHAAIASALARPLSLLAPVLLKARLAGEAAAQRDDALERWRISELANRRLNRFVPEHLRHAAESPRPAASAGEELRVPVVFGQLYDLARLSRLEKSETLAELQTYYRRIDEALTMHQGTLERVMGDRWIAKYPGGTESAVWGVLTLHQMLLTFRDELTAMGLPVLNTGLGLHLGDTLGGTVETDQHIEPILIGEGVQTASRLAEMCRTFRTGILISDEAVQALEDVSPFDLRSLGLFRTAPGERRVGVYELYSARKPEQRDAMRERQGEWNAAMSHYRRGEWKEGAQLFKSYLGRFPQDRPGRHFLRYCRQRIGQ